MNANQYARHPKLQFPYDCPEITYDSKNLFAILLREEASIISDPIKAVIKEAAVTCNDKKWSGMFDNHSWSCLSIKEKHLVCLPRF